MLAHDKSSIQYEVGLLENECRTLNSRVGWVLSSRQRKDPVRLNAVKLLRSAFKDYHDVDNSCGHFDRTIALVKAECTQCYDVVGAALLHIPMHYKAPVEIVFFTTRANVRSCGHGTLLLGAIKQLANMMGFSQIVVHASQDSIDFWKHMSSNTLHRVDHGMHPLKWANVGGSVPFYVVM